MWSYEICASQSKVNHFKMTSQTITFIVTGWQISMTIITHFLSTCIVWVSFQAKCQILLVFSIFSKSSTIMRPKVPPPLPPKVWTSKWISHGQWLVIWGNFSFVTLKNVETTHFIFYLLLVLLSEYFQNKRLPGLEFCSPEYDKWTQALSWSVFSFSPSPSAHLSNNKNKTTANHTVRMTAEGEGPSSGVQVLKCRAQPSPPPASPRGPHPRSCHLIAAVA